MRFIPAGVGGVALPVACVAAPARDARAPLVHIARCLLYTSDAADE